MTHEIQIAFGKRLRQLRLEKVWSQEEFADRAGIHRTYVGAIERGERNVSLLNIHKITNALGISISEMFKNV